MTMLTKFINFVNFLIRYSQLLYSRGVNLVCMKEVPSPIGRDAYIYIIYFIRYRGNIHELDEEKLYRLPDVVYKPYYLRMFSKQNYMTIEKPLLFMNVVSIDEIFELLKQHDLYSYS